MRGLRVLRLLTALALVAGPATSASAQEASPDSREAAIAAAQAEKSKNLAPYTESRAEKLMGRVSEILAGGGMKLHPFFQSAYSGGGFTLGAGYAHYVSPYSVIDARGSYTIAGYKRAEVEFVSPRLFNRRGTLSVLGGWREATQVGFYGLGSNTPKDARTNYAFQQPYGSALLTVRPRRRTFLLQGGVEFTQWTQQPGSGVAPSVETAYTPETLPGLGASPTYLHTQGTFGFDWRPSPGYARRGGYYGVTFHDYTDRDAAFGFRQVDYEAIQHVPVLREAWTISLHGLVSTTSDKDGQQVPFFMLPSVGSGSTLRAFAAWRFRDQNSMLLQAEWRIMVNRFLDTAVFYDTGKVAVRKGDLNFDNLRHNLGFGVRFHGPTSTPLRVELAHGSEGFNLVFSSSAVF